MEDDQKYVVFQSCSCAQRLESDYEEAPRKFVYICQNIVHLRFIQ